MNEHRGTDRHGLGDLLFRTRDYLVPLTLAFVVLTTRPRDFLSSGQLDTTLTLLGLVLVLWLKKTHRLESADVAATPVLVRADVAA